MSEGTKYQLQLIVHGKNVNDLMALQGQLLGLMNGHGLAVEVAVLELRKVPARD